MNLVMRISDQVVALDFGRLIADGTPADVRANPEVDPRLSRERGMTPPILEARGLEGVLRRRSRCCTASISRSRRAA